MRRHWAGQREHTRWLARGETTFAGVCEKYSALSGVQKADGRRLLRVAHAFAGERHCRVHHEMSHHPIDPLHPDDTGDVDAVPDDQAPAGLLPGGLGIVSREQKLGAPRPRTVMVSPEGIPAELKAIPRWVCWRWQHDGQKWRKPPISCRGGRPADITDPATWTSFEDALAYFQENDLAGVGLVLAADGYCGVDLDNCHDPSTGRIRPVEPWAADIVEQLASYTEWSPSGSGLKVFVRALLPSDGRRKENIEVYGRRHYFTVTGQRLNNAPTVVESRQPELLRLYHERLGDEVVMTDEEVISRARRAANGDKFVALFDKGRMLPEHQSDSEADLALAAILAFWLRGNPARVEALFGQSALAKRKKWQRADYRERTIRRALAGLVEFCQPGRMLTRVARVNQADPVNPGVKNTAGVEVISAGRQAPSGSARPTPEGRSTESHKQEKAGAMAVELAEKDAALPLWQASFRLARRLRKVNATAPQQFEKAVWAYCQKSGRPFEDVWYDFLVVWTKVETAEGDDPLTWAAEMAKAEPYPLPCSFGPLDDSIAGLAWHLSRLTSGKAFFLPRQRLGELYGRSAMTISRVVTLLERKNIIRRSDKTYSYVNGEAQEYTFTGPAPGKSEAA